MSAAAVPLTEAEWFALGSSRFGSDVMRWRFVCPACGHVQAVEDFRGKVRPGTSADIAFFSCIGRFAVDARRAFGGSGPGPCDYTSGGLFNLSPVTVVTAAGETRHVFEFAPAGEVLAAPVPDATALVDTAYGRLAGALLPWSTVAKKQGGSS